MKQHGDLPDLGAQDPERRNSPVAEEGDDDSDVLRQAIPGEPFCCFNDTDFPHGAYIRTGTVILRCDRGIWVPVGPSDPDNP